MPDPTPTNSQQPGRDERSNSASSNEVWAKQFTTALTLNDVARTYRGPGLQSCTALRNITAKVHKGEMVAIAGPSGSGKTTLLNIIAGLDRPDAGSVEFNGTEITLLTDKALHQHRLHRLGLIFQTPRLIPVLSAAENVELPLVYRRDIPKRTRKHRVEESLGSVGLLDKRTHFPQALSGGERQRVSLARALAGDPLMIVADEPTSHLDREHAASFMQLIRELSRTLGTTLIFSTHDAYLLTFSTQTLFLHNGILSSGQLR